MISQLRGKLIIKSSTEVVIDCGGVGYSAFVSLNTSEKLPDEGENVNIFTLLIPREDALQLFGFGSQAEREAFKMLISISGVGPKIALGILSSVAVPELREYILVGNIHSLQKLPGIGKKTAERLILELRDKITRIGDVEISTPGELPLLIKQEAVSALITLGYTRPAAEKAIRSALDSKGGKELTAESLIRKALQFAKM